MMRLARSPHMQDALRQLRSAAVSVGVYSVVINLLMLVPTIYMLQVYDRVLSVGNVTTLVLVSLLAGALLVLAMLADWQRSRVLASAGAWLERALSPALFAIVQREQAGHAGRSDSGGPFHDLHAWRGFFAGPGAVMLLDLPWVPVYILAASLLHPVLGWVACACGLVQLALAVWSRRTLVALLPAQAHTGAALRAFQAAKLRHADVSEALGMVSALCHRWLAVRQQEREAHDRVSAARQRMAALSKVVRYIQQALVLSVGALLVIDGSLTAGAMIAANLLVTRALTPIDQLASQWQPLLAAFGAHRQLDAALAKTPTDVAPDLAQQAGPSVSGLQAVDVCAHVPGRSQPVLDGVTLALGPGCIAVLMGPSGSGKSTLARALVGASPGATGEIHFNGRPLASLAASERIGYLPQELDWIPGTVAEQIARFEAPPDAAAVVAAAQAAGLHDMVLRLPHGYDTWIDGGSGVSGGQLQRIALARALYKAPQFVVLDEPNAHLDEAGERALAAALRGLRERGATAVVISHRPAVRAVADRSFRMDRGRLEEHPVETPSPPSRSAAT